MRSKRTLPCGRWKIASVKRRRRRDSRRENGDRRIEAENSGSRGCCRDRKSTRLNSSHGYISYAVFCLKKKKNYERTPAAHPMQQLDINFLSPRAARLAESRPPCRVVLLSHTWPTFGDPVWRHISCVRQ